MRWRYESCMIDIRVSWDRHTNITTDFGQTYKYYDIHANLRNHKNDMRATYEGVATNIRQTCVCLTSACSSRDLGYINRVVRAIRQQFMEEVRINPLMVLKARYIFHHQLGQQRLILPVHRSAEKPGSSPQPPPPSGLLPPQGLSHDVAGNPHNSQLLWLEESNVFGQPIHPGYDNCGLNGDKCG